MRLLLSALIAFLVLPMMLATHLNAGDVRKVYPEQAIVGDEPAPFSRDGWSGKDIPSPPKLFAVGTIVDSTMYDFQGNGSYGRHIVAIGDSSLHATVMVSPDAGFLTRGMKYIYYANNLFTNFGYIEGSGTGDQRAGFGSITSYYVPEVGLGNVAISCSHTNLDGRAFGSHFYSFTDAFQGVGAFTPAEGDPGGGSDVCDAFLWPTLTVMNDITGSMAMAGLTGNAVCGTGADEIGVVQKNFMDATWGTLTRLHTMNDPSQWTGPGPNIPVLEGSDNGRMVISSAEFGTNVYYWESTDGGVTWGERQDVTGFPITPHFVPPDSTSTEYRPLQNGSVAMSRDGTPHIFWTAYQARGVVVGPDTLYTPGVDAVYQYRTKLEHWDPANGITTVYRHPDGLSNVAQGTLFAYNVGHPTIGFGPTDDIIYVVYEGFVDTDIDPTNGSGFGDIYVSMSTDGGATWEDRVNITNTVGDDDLFPAIARYNEQGAFSELPGFTTAGGDGVNDFVLTYQNDDVAGTFLNGEETSANWDMLLVAPVDFDEIEVTGIGDGGADQGGGIPKAFALGQNYPNPFNPSTSISYQLAERSEVTLKIHNVRGQLVRKLVSGVQDAGTHTVQWNGKDASGQTVSSGIYLYVLETGQNFRSTRKMVLLK